MNATPMTDTTHVWTAPDTDRSADWAAGVSFDAFLPTAEALTDVWTRAWARAAVPPETVARAAAVPGSWRLLALSEDWCIDATNVLPILARLAEAVPSFELRLLARDTHLELMDEHLTGGRSRAIPVVLLLDEHNREQAWWGPRPAPLQAWVLGEGQTLENADRYREIRKWHLRDGGHTVLNEVVAMVEGAAQRTLADGAPA